MRQARLHVEVGPGVFSSERSVSFTVAGTRYTLIVDKDDVAEPEGLLNIRVLAERGDEALIDLPRDTFTSGRRISVPRQSLLPVPA